MTGTIWERMVQMFWNNILGILSFSPLRDYIRASLPGLWPRDEMQEGVRDLRIGVGILSGQTTELRTEVGSLSGQTTELRTEVGSLSGETTELRTEVGSLSGETTQLRTALETYQAALEIYQTGLNSDLASLDATIQTTGSDSTSAISSLQTSMDAGTSENRELTNHLKRALGILARNPDDEPKLNFIEEVRAVIKEEVSKILDGTQLTLSEHQSSATQSARPCSPPQNTDTPTTGPSTSRPLTGDAE
ncbi:hypothetical protein FQN54_000369 [Arachnomyces sp. PD_36]|nr:hypothetical protein FQN54_000369 [Arachnomyces sp. PD_36]